MQKITWAILSLLLVFSSCTEKPKGKRSNQGAMAHSVGRINELSVVMSNDLWKGRIGDSIRKYLGAEVPGLPQEEPLFSMRQMPPEAFSGLARKNRTFLRVSKSETPQINQLNNKYATPQMGFVISGKTEDEIINTFKDNLQTIVSQYKSTETKTKQDRIRKSLEKLPQLEEKFGITLDIPSAYRIAREDDDFIWLRKDITNGDMNLVIYELPLNNLKKDSTAISNIIRLRDSVGSLKIPTASEGKFITEEAYAPYLYETELDSKFTYETKGTWEIKDRYMAGPFVNYMIEDKENNRLLIIEGFILAPSVRKRDNMFELEAIAKTVDFK